MADMTVDDLIDGLVKRELADQIERWGDQCENRPLRWAVILAEETGEVAKATLEGHSEADLIAEIVDVKAVCQAWLRCIFRPSFRRPR